MYDCFYCYSLYAKLHSNKQTIKHILIVVKCLQLSTNNIGSATEIVCRRKEEYTQKDCGEPFDGHECENCKYTEER